MDAGAINAKPTLAPRRRHKTPSVKRIHHDLKKVSKIPAGMQFVQLTAELLRSPAWRCRSINCVRLIDFLLIEHLQHNGSENGNLRATYNQLVAFGIGRRLIHDTIEQAERLGLIEVHREPRRTFTDDYPLRFRLTFLADRVINEKSQPYYGSPTDDWRRITKEKATEITGWKFRI